MKMCTIWLCAYRRTPSIRIEAAAPFNFCFYRILMHFDQIKMQFFSFVCCQCVLVLVWAARKNIDANTKHSLLLCCFLRCSSRENKNEIKNATIYFVCRLITSGPAAKMSNKSTQCTEQREKNIFFALSLSLLHWPIITENDKHKQQ